MQERSVNIRVHPTITSALEAIGATHPARLAGSPEYIAKHPFVFVSIHFNTVYQARAFATRAEYEAFVNDPAFAPDDLLEYDFSEGGTAVLGKACNRLR
jgi:hypothetical protein